MKLVTIAVASYNNAQYIERCLNSIINQTYNQLEVIVVDDGSTDNSLERIEKFGDKRIKIIKKENGGLSSVRQKALDLASGEYISFIDADDFLHPQYVEFMVRKLESDTSDICICSTKFVNESLEEIKSGSNSYHIETSEKPTRPYLDMCDVQNVLTKLLLSDSWNKLYRLSVINSAKVKFCMPKGLNGTDKLFNNALAVHSPSYSSISDQLYIHVLYKKSAVHRKGKKLLDSMIIITKEIINQGHSNNTPLSILCKYSSVIYYSSLRAALQDVYNERDFFSFVTKDLNELYNKHKLFVDSYPELDCNPYYMETLSGKLFCFILSYLKLLLPFYFLLRKHAI